jgi:hypothetical protein
MILYEPACAMVPHVRMCSHSSGDNMRRLAFVLTSFLAASALAGPPHQKAGALGPLVVVDSAGKTVGRLATSAGLPVVYVTINSVQTSYPLALLSSSGFVDYERVEPLSAGRQIHFATSNCTGTAYMQDGDGTRAIARQAIVLQYNGQNWLYVAQAVPPATITLGSVFQTGGCGPTTGTVIGVPLNAPINLSTMFAEPYTVQ